VGGARYHHDAHHGDEHDAEGGASVTPIRWAAVAFVAAFMVAGCDPTPVMLKTIAVTSVGVSQGYKVLRVKDHENLAAITAEAKAGDKVKARADLDAYLPKYSTAEKALDGTAAGLQDALDAVPAIQMAKDKASAATWIAKLAQLYADAVATAQAIGATLPKVVQ